MKKGFTLLEVLIALSVLAISMLGIYSLLNQSITMTDYSKSRLTVINMGYERVLRQVHYPRVSLGGTEERDNKTYTYVYHRHNTLLPGVTNVLLQVKGPDAIVTYEYFERGSGL